MFARKIAMKSPFSLDTSSTITIFPGKITIFPCKHHDFPHFSYVKSPFFPRCSAVDAGHPVTGHRGHLRAVPTTFRMANEDHQLLGRKILMGLWGFTFEGMHWHVSPLSLLKIPKFNGNFFGLYSIWGLIHHLGASPNFGCVVYSIINNPRNQHFYGTIQPRSPRSHPSFPGPPRLLHLQTWLLLIGQMMIDDKILG
jgi:hypothetical protein